LINNNQKTIVVCSNYAWTIFNFRMPLIKSLTKSGYRVIVITQFDGYEKKIANEVNKVIPLFISRKGVNPLIDLATLFDLIRILFELKPDYFLPFTIKPVIYGSIASRILNITYMPMITGLGTVFISNNWITKIVKLLYRFALIKASVVFFQNDDDKDLFLQNKIINYKVCKLTPGSGVDLEKFLYTEMPTIEEISFLFIARMIKDKGLIEFVDAAKHLKKTYPQVKFKLLGPLEVENRTSVSRDQLYQWVDEGVVEYLGETDDVSYFIKESTCVVLPSYREGTPRVLLEAASIGRPIIATDVPGCREVINNGINGYLCKSHDAIDLASKMSKMIMLPNTKRKEMGKNGRRKVEQEFSHEIVSEIYIDSIKRL
jgi:glycosyltransferase involved in cell wall biosynthesis